MMTETDDPLFTACEAAEYLRCSVSFLAKERMKVNGPAFIRIGRAIRYSRSALEAYKTANTRVSTAEYDCSRENRQTVKSDRPLPQMSGTPSSFQYIAIHHHLLRARKIRNLHTSSRYPI